MRSIAATMEIAPGRTQAFSVYGDERLRVRHQSLMKYYEELLKEIEAKKNKLQMMKRKKLTLRSEVRFLRRRHQYLTSNQPSTSRVDGNSVKPQHTKIQSKKKAKESNYSRKAAALSCPLSGIDLNKKGKAYYKKEVSVRNPVLVFDLNQKLNTSPVLDLNHNERVYSRKEAVVHSSTPVFDLNQISREEEELQFKSEPWRVEESKKSSVRGGSDEQLKDMKLSIWRNIGNEGIRTGKRKISWQDQVALRV